jgi:hypothetical protein
VLIESFRELYELVIEKDWTDLYADVLEPQIDAARRLLAPLRHLQTLRDAPPGSIPDLTQLFALSALNDYLLLPLRLSESQYRHFFQELGFEVFEPDGIFSPLRCEIVGVANWESAESGICLGARYWPGLRFGEMIFSRSALDVRCHPSHGIVRGIADRSPLFFTNRRMRREVHDLSHGWGSNSRWRTDFSRNYETGGYAFLNVDAEYDLATIDHANKALDSLPLDAACELLLHRCFVRYPGNADFPYKWRIAVENKDPLWPLESSKVVPFETALHAAGVTVRRDK